MHSFNEYLLSASSVLGPADTLVNKIEMVFALKDLS